MKNILIFAGTTEGRRVSEVLAASGIAHLVSVATEYGEMVMTPHPLVRVLQGRLNEVEMADVINRHEIEIVVDATHLYAGLVTQQIKEAAKRCGIIYLRLQREMTKLQDANIHYFANHEACAKALKEVSGNILLTTGSKDLPVYCKDTSVKERLFVRVLPGIESLKLCAEQELCGRQILALQGPFSTELNEALIDQYQIRCIVTKESGKAGGYPEKVEAARKKQIPVFVIGHAEETGDSFIEVCEALESLLSSTIKKTVDLEITLAGIGMGAPSCQTKDVQEAILEADILLGAERMIREFSAKIEKKPYYLADQIVPYLQEKRKQMIGYDRLRVVVLFSGDSGFYSGCQKLCQALKPLDAEVKVLPGISSVSYLASCLGESYHDAQILSIHGRKTMNLAKKIASAEKTFLLMSGTQDLHQLGKVLLNAGLTSCEINAGFHLSYPEQKLLVLHPEECEAVTEEGLLTCLIKNPNPQKRIVSPGVPDMEFLRDKVPMTKEEVREVSICKLHLQNDSIVYDIGSGTGSIAVELARLSDSIEVYAVERKKEALALIRRNQERFGLENITVVEAEAPCGLEELPVPTHAFIGGSGRKLKEILHLLYEKNPTMRIVVNAISMESICEIREVLEQFPVTNEQVVQMQVSRAKAVGGYHLMQAENPVWICAFDFVPESVMKGEHDET